MASLKERVREVGVKMAIGASGREVFKEFMTEALADLERSAALVGLLAGVGFSKVITAAIGIPLYMDPKSFVCAFLLATAFGFLFALYPALKAAVSRRWRRCAMSSRGDALPVTAAISASGERRKLGFAGTARPLRRGRPRAASSSCGRTSCGRC